MDIDYDERFVACKQNGCRDGYIYSGNSVTVCDCLRKFEERDNILKLTLYCNMPADYVNCRLDNFEVLGKSSVNYDSFNKVKRFAELFDSHLYHGDGLILSGPNNCGKTHLAAALQILTIQKFKSLMSYFILLTTFINLNTRTWGSHKDQNDLDIIDRIRNCKFLVLDDVDKTVFSSGSFKKELLDELLRYRQGNKKSTIITTNLIEKTELSSFLGVHTFNLLMRNNYFLKFEGNYTGSLKSKLEERL